MASDRSCLSRYRCLTMCLLATAGGAAALLSAATAARRIRYLTVARSRYVSPRFVARGAAPLPVVFASAASVTAPKPPLQPTLLEWWTTERAAIAPGLVLYVVHSVLRDAMARCGISFPASIVGMLAGFAVLMAARAVRAEAAETLARFLEPAARLFRSWLAALFAPGLITLPLVMPSLPARELAWCLVLSAGGFFVSVATGAMIAAACAPRKLQVSGAPSGDCRVTQPLDIPAAAPPPPSAAAYMPFPRSLQRMLGALAVLGGAAYLVSGSALALTLALLSTTLGSFALATTSTPARMQIWVHPFLQCSGATLLACAALGELSGRGWGTVLSAYAAPGGAASVLTRLLGPCVLSFGLQVRTADCSRLLQIAPRTMCPFIWAAGERLHADCMLIVPGVFSCEGCGLRRLAPDGTRVP